MENNQKQDFSYIVKARGIDILGKCIDWEKVEYRIKTNDNALCIVDKKEYLEGILEQIKKENSLYVNKIIKGIYYYTIFTLNTNSEIHKDNDVILSHNNDRYKITDILYDESKTKPILMVENINGELIYNDYISKENYEKFQKEKEACMKMIQEEIDK